MAEVCWKHLMYGSHARPRAKFILWMACHHRLATKDRLRRFGILQEDKCCFCSSTETLEHLFFMCSTTRRIWDQILHWLQVRHIPINWTEELEWILVHSKGKGWQAKMLKLAFTEIIYALWCYRNTTCFGQQNSIGNLVHPIIDRMTYKAWMYSTLESHLGHLMVGN